MLQRFEIENYRGFSEKLVFDLTVHDCAFNSNLIHNDIVERAIIYGENGIGKSTLGFALFDIITHLTDNKFLKMNNYRNLDHIDKPARFCYVFKFGNDTINYEYEKLAQANLCWEKVSLNGKILIDYNYFSVSEENRFVSDELKGNLNISLPDNKLSIMKYIYRNTPTNPLSPVAKIITFCEKMLWYRSLSEGNSYMGFTSGCFSPTEIIYENNKLNDFQIFLKENGLDYELDFESKNGKHVLYAYFDGKKSKILFSSIASTGIQTLMLFYACSIKVFSSISFLFIDDFDVFLHYESAEKLVRILNGYSKFQSVLTTHNANLMQNNLIRPDCCFLMTQNKLTNLYGSINWKTKG
jgi:AAA15 family ATPase/GTPase